MSFKKKNLSKNDPGKTEKVNLDDFELCILFLNPFI